VIALALVGSLMFFGDPTPVALAFTSDHRLVVTGRGTTYSYQGSRLDRATPALPSPSGETQTLPDLPPGSRATHVSAYASSRGIEILAAYDEGLWERQGGPWQRIAAPGLERVRALAVSDGRIATAIEAGEIWTRHQNRWQKFATPTGPVGSIYGLATYHGNLFAASFEHGISEKQGDAWSRVMPPVISTPHPRECVVFRDQLYARYSTGEVDRFDGKTWTKNVFPWLLRGGATCLFASKTGLWVGQYGGYSRFDGTRWTHDLKRPELRNAVTTALFADGKTLWLGTQDRGLFRITGIEIRQFDQRQGLGDDWVRHIYARGNNVFVGLFRTGAYRRDGNQFIRIMPVVRNESTGILPWGKSAMVLSSREGLYTFDRGTSKRIATGDYSEIQSITKAGTDLWLGLPTGIARLRLDPPRK